MADGAARVVLVSTLREPLQDTLAWVGHQLRAGFEHLDLFFDDPGDPAIPALAGDARITCTPCDAAHWRELGVEPAGFIEARQIANAGLALERARARGADWIVHVDGDELVHCEEGLPAVLAGDWSSDVVRFRLLEGVPDRPEYADPFAGIGWFRVPPTRGRVLAARLLGCRRAFYCGEFIRGHTASKVAVRVSAPVTAMRMHRPLGPGGEPLPDVSTDRIALLHFDARSLEAWRAKWRQRGDGTATAERMRGSRERQLAEFAAIEPGDDAAFAALFERIYFVPAWERRVLAWLGLLVRVRVR